MIPNLAQQVCMAASVRQPAAEQEAQDPRTGPLQEDILSALRECPAGLTTNELASRLCVSHQNIDCSLRGLLRREAITRAKGRRKATHRNQIKKVWVYRITPAGERQP